uniref:hypothetical protein n=1 Tax=Sinomonas humi TaxID=1338436 RepID=UPI002F41735C
MVLRAGNPCGADAHLGAGGVAGGDFPVQDRGEVFLVCPAGVAGLLGEPARGLLDPGCLQCPGEVVDALEGLCAHAVCSFASTGSSAMATPKKASYSARSRTIPASSMVLVRGCWKAARSRAAVRRCSGSVTLSALPQGPDLQERKCSVLQER